MPLPARKRRIASCLAERCHSERSEEYRRVLGSRPPRRFSQGFLLSRRPRARSPHICNSDGDNMGRSRAPSRFVGPARAHQARRTACRNLHLGLLQQALPSTPRPGALSFWSADRGLSSLSRDLRRIRLRRPCPAQPRDRSSLDGCGFAVECRRRRCGIPRPPRQYATATVTYWLDTGPGGRSASLG